MTQQEIIEKITPIFQEVFNDDELEVNIELTSEDIEEWSSLTQTIMLTKIEEVFGIVFKLREVAEMDNVEAIVSMIEEKIA
jgi:acyl carrier protein